MKQEKTKPMSARQYHKLFLFLAFFVPFEMMIVVFARGIVFPFGPETALTSDLYHQYMPVFQEFVNKIRAGEGILYSWNMGMGTNFFIVYANNLSSPLHWFAFLFPDKYLVEFITYLITVKVGLAGITSFIFFNGRSENKESIKDGYYALLFSVCYAMCGFVAANYYTIMWLDCIIVTPIILLGLEQLVKEGKFGIYVISLAFCIYSNFYLAFMICVFLTLYFLVLFFTEKRCKNTFLRFAGGSFLAGGMASFVLLPIISFAMNSHIESAPYPSQWKTYFSVFKVLARHCMLVEASGDHGIWPNIYCGTAVFLFVPLYFMNKKIQWKKKIGFFLLITIFLLSFMTNKLDYLWHGLNYPSGFPARHSFLYVLIILTMGYDCMICAEGTNLKKVFISFAGAGVFLVLTKFFFQSEDFHKWDWLVTFLFVLGYAICLCLYYLKNDEKVLEKIALICYVLVVAECTMNMSESSIIIADRDPYVNNGNDYKALYKRNKGDNGDFQRFESFSIMTDNDSTLYGYPSATLFSSMLNTNTGEFYEKMGLRHGKVFYEYNGVTPFCSALMNVSKFFSWSFLYNDEFYKLIDQENHVKLYQLKYQLPFGYVAPKGFDLPAQGDAIYSQNYLVKELGIEKPLFQKMECSVEGKRSKFETNQDGFYYAVLLKNNIPQISMEIIGQESNCIFEFVKENYILDLDYIMAGQMLSFYETDSTESDDAISIDVYRLNLDVLDQAIEKLGRNHMTNVKVKDTHVSGQLEMEMKGRLITSVPYDKGWTIFVNGKRVPAQTFGGAFIALDLDAGSYEIEMRYFPGGLKTGIIISCICLGIFVLLIVKGRKGHRLGDFN